MQSLPLRSSEPIRSVTLESQCLGFVWERDKVSTQIEVVCVSWKSAFFARPGRVCGSCSILLAGDGCSRTGMETAESCEINQHVFTYSILYKMRSMCVVYLFQHVTSNKGLTTSN